MYTLLNIGHRLASGLYEAYQNDHHISRDELMKITMACAEEMGLALVTRSLEHEPTGEPLRLRKLNHFRHSKLIEELDQLREQADQGFYKRARVPLARLREAQPPDDEGNEAMTRRREDEQTAEGRGAPASPVDFDALKSSD